MDLIWKMKKIIPLIETVTDYCDSVELTAGCPTLVLSVLCLNRKQNVETLVTRMMTGSLSLAIEVVGFFY